MRETLAALLIGITSVVALSPETVALWVFHYQSALFELQYQAAEEAMK